MITIAILEGVTIESALAQGMEWRLFKPDFKNAFMEKSLGRILELGKGDTRLGEYLFIRETLDSRRIL